MENMCLGGLLLSMLLLIKLTHAQIPPAECLCEEAETAKIKMHIDDILGNGVTKREFENTQEEMTEKIDDILEKVCNISTMLTGNEGAQNPSEKILDVAGKEYTDCLIAAMPVLTEWIENGTPGGNWTNLPLEVKDVLTVMYCHLDWKYMQTFVRMRKLIVAGNWEKAAKEIKKSTWNKIVNKTLAKQLAQKLKALGNTQ